jgi:hypothetical protein
MTLTLSGKSYQVIKLSDTRYKITGKDRSVTIEKIGWPVHWVLVAGKMSNDKVQEIGKGIEEMEK